MIMDYSPSLSSKSTLRLLKYAAIFPLFFFQLTHPLEISLIQNF